MTKSELTELQHIKLLLSKLQQLQMSTIFDPNLSITLETGCYLHSVRANVFVGHINEIDCSEKRLATFELHTWHNPRHNENICNGCIAFVNAHLTKTPKKIQKTE